MVAYILKFEGNIKKVECNNKNLQILIQITLSSVLYRYNYFCFHKNFFYLQGETILFLNSPNSYEIRITDLTLCIFDKYASAEK